MTSVILMVKSSILVKSHFREKTWICSWVTLLNLFAKILRLRWLLHVSCREMFWTSDQKCFVFNTLEKTKWNFEAKIYFPTRKGRLFISSINLINGSSVWWILMRCCPITDSGCCTFCWWCVLSLAGRIGCPFPTKRAEVWVQWFF